MGPLFHFVLMTKRRAIFLFAIAFKGVDGELDHCWKFNVHGPYYSV